MFNLFKQDYRLNTTSSANQMIYMLQKSPFLKRALTDSIYAVDSVKVLFRIAVTIFRVIAGFLKKFLYVGLMIFFACQIFPKVNSANLFIHYFLMLNFLVGSFLVSPLLKPTKEKYTSVILMRMNANDYYKASMIIRLCKESICFLPPLLVFGILAKVSVIQILLLLIGLSLSRFIGEALQVAYYRRYHNTLEKNMVFQFGFLIFGLAVAYGIPYLNYLPNYQVLLPIVVLVVLCISIPCMLFLFHYKNYQLIAKKLLIHKNIVFDTDQVMKETTFSMIQLKEKDITSSEKYQHKKGYDYLTAIFYDRHRRIITKPVKIQSLAILVVMVILFVVCYFVPDVRGNLIKMIMNSLPLIIFVIYICSNGEKVCKAMFYNCDHSFLSYHFYREPHVILNNFKIRLIRIMKLNMIPATMIAIGLDLLLFFYSSTPVSASIYISIFLAILAISAFFSVHHLFLYYIFQPYDIDLKAKSPIYSIVNYATYFLCYYGMQMRVSTSIFCVVTIFFTVTYIAIALYVLYKKAPTTFRLK